MRLKVRDLMRHVRAKGINNTRGCLTKAEVVDLLATVPTITLLMDDLNINEERPRHANEVSCVLLSSSGAALKARNMQGGGYHEKLRDLLVDVYCITIFFSINI